MSRVGSSPIDIPSEVEISLDVSHISVKGPKGNLSTPQFKNINVRIEDNKVILDVVNKSKDLRQKWGLQRSLINNMIQGVTKEYSKQLDIIGVGYRVELSGKSLILKLGFSHDINFAIPNDINITVVKPTQLIISGIDKQKVGQVASDIRSYCRPEPYKGKGIRYTNEFVLSKQVKKK